MASKENCGKIIIAAHTIQRSRVLNAICDATHKVLTFEPNNKGQFSVKEVGWKGASTFRAFCDRHDGVMFEPLEQRPFTGNPEQIFLLCYRAFCWETYQKERALLGAPKLHELIPQGAPPWERIVMKHLLSIQDSGYKKGLEELRRQKKQLDADLLAKNYSQYSYAEIVLAGTPIVAATGAISPNFSLSGSPLQKLDMHCNMEWLSFAIDITSIGSHFIFCWDRSQHVPNMYMAEILSLDEKRLSSFLCQVCFMHCENTYFSKLWWEGLTSSDRNYLTQLMNIGNPYAEPPSYELHRNVASWEVHSIRSSLILPRPA